MTQYRFDIVDIDGTLNVDGVATLQTTALIKGTLFMVRSSQTGGSTTGDIVIAGANSVRFAHTTTSINVTYNIAGVYSAALRYGDVNWETVIDANSSITLNARPVIPSTVAASAVSGSDIGLSGTTQTTIGANGAASALTANPLGYLVAYKGSTKIIIPYYNG